jgi:hypothetical protein
VVAQAVGGGAARHALDRGVHHHRHVGAGQDGGGRGQEALPRRRRRPGESHPSPTTFGFLFGIELFWHYLANNLTRSPLPRSPLPPTNKPNPLTPNPSPLTQPSLLSPLSFRTTPWGGSRGWRKLSASRFPWGWSAGRVGYSLAPGGCHSTGNIWTIPAVINWICFGCHNGCRQLMNGV